MSTNESSSDNSYDRVPYPSWPFVQSHPDRMAAIATLLGLHPIPIETASVIELGCAAGGNIIPIAAMYPEGNFLGVDMSARAIEDGNARIARLGLRNITLLEQDILEIPLSGKPFDYLIAHGVFSWVPQTVRDHIFVLCEKRLHDRSLAYISYNTFPGWRMRGMIRDMLVYHSKQFHDPEKQIHQARALLQFMAESVSTDSAYGVFLKQELELFQHISDEYVFHDHLEGVNDPVYFHEFMARAGHHGLQYLGEPHLSSMATSAFSPEVEETLHRISKDVVQIEQYMDFLKNRSFRQSILCKATQPVDRSFAPKNAMKLSFASPLQRFDEVDDTGNNVTAYRYKGVRVTSENVGLCSALDLLGSAWPHWIPFETLVSHCRAQCHPVESDAIFAEELAQHLIRCYAKSLINIHVAAPQFVTQISDKPMVTPLVREQACQGVKVTNRRHEVVKLNESVQQIVRLLDGNHDYAMIRAELLHQARAGTLTLQLDNQVVPEAEFDTACDTVVQAALAHLCDVALLVG